MEKAALVDKLHIAALRIEEVLLELDPPFEDKEWKDKVAALSSEEAADVATQWRKRFLKFQDEAKLATDKFLVQVAEKLDLNEEQVEKLEALVADYEGR